METKINIKDNDMNNNKEQLTVATLIEILNLVEDKTLPIRVQSENPTDEDNQWVDGVELHNTGESGYEVEGEVTLTTSN